MNDLLNVCYIHWVRPTFLLKKMHDFNVLNKCVTDRLTDRLTNLQTQPIKEI